MSQASSYVYILLRICNWVLAYVLHHNSSLPFSSSLSLFFPLMIAWLAEGHRISLSHCITLLPVMADRFVFMAVFKTLEASTEGYIGHPA